MRAVLRWYGVFVVDGGRVVEERPFDRGTLASRLAAMTKGDWTAVDALLTDPAYGFHPPEGPDPWTVDDDADGVELPGPGAFSLDERDLRMAAAEAGRALAREALRSEDQEIIRIVEALDDLQRAHVLVDARVRDWRAISGYADTGTGPSSEALASSLASLEGARSALESELARVVASRAPNLSRLIGAEIAGRLIARARGLDRLARMPAGTIQVLGAERAFFRHLRGGGRMPKHGHLYMHPWVHRAPRNARGKAARSLAAKAAIASRADAFGGDLGNDLVESMEARSRALASGGRRP